ncbi:MAG: M23 family metallopeptidase [Eubacteriaceae bacterium]|nr:M23 family metallopeptidase [Eubacteriaceae bacterium]
MNKREGLRAAGLLLVSLIIVAGILSLASRERKGPVDLEDDTPGGIAGIEDFIANQGDLGDMFTNENMAGEQSGDGRGQIAITPEAIGENIASVEAGSQSVSLELMNPVGSPVVSMAFSYNTAPVFSQTFGEYRSDHNGVDLQADFGAEVSAAMNGRVSQTRHDSKLGWLVVVDHGSKTLTEYGNLDEIYVKEGQSVTTSTVLGTVGKSAPYEIMNTSHLHFGLQLDDQYIDPIPYMQIYY